MRHDAIVIGGSYAGLSAAIHIARARRRVSVIDAGEPRNRFASASHGFFGFDGARPGDMITQARAKLLAYPTVAMIDGRAVAARREAEGFAVALASGETLEATKLVLAFGVTDVLPDMPGLPERWGRTVLHCPYCHGYEFGGQRLGVLYAAPHSAHQALLISDWGPTTLFLDGHDGLDDATLAKLAARSVAVEPGAVAGLEGEAPGLAGVRLVDGRLVEVAALYTATRTRPASGIAADLGCAFDDSPFGPVIRTDATKLTTVPGVYAAGDVARAPHNATWAASDGVTAGTALHQALVFGPLERVGRQAAA